MPAKSKLTDANASAPAIWMAEKVIQRIVATLKPYGQNSRTGIVRGKL